MEILGHVRSAQTQDPVEDVRVLMTLEDRDFATSTDSAGNFVWREDSSYVGKLLTCRVEKAGFEPKEVTQRIERDEIRLVIELVANRLSRWSVSQLHESGGRY